MEYILRFVAPKLFLIAIEININNVLKSMSTRSSNPLTFEYEWIKICLI